MHLKVSRIGSLLLLASLGGCVNLKAVADYANRSAQFTADIGLATRYRDTYRREAPYLNAAMDRLERDTDARRQAEYQDLIKIHQTLTAYLNILAQLASVNTYQSAIDTGNLDSNLQQPAAVLGFSTAQMDAVAGLTNVVTRIVRARGQEVAIEQLVKEADPHVQTLVVAMQQLNQIYQETNRNEKAMVLDVFKFYIPTTQDGPPPAPVSGGSLLLNRVARSQFLAKSDEYALTEEAYPKARKGWAALAQGHHQLAQGLGKLSGKALVAALKPMADDLKVVKNGI